MEIKDVKNNYTKKKEYKNVKKNDNDKNAETSTVGNLSVYNEKGENIFSCFTLENGGTSTHISGTDRRILAGVYYLRWTSSNTNSGLAIQYDYWKKENQFRKNKRWNARKKHSCMGYV